MPKKKKTDIKKNKRPRGRPRVCYEFEHARELVRSEQIESIRQYIKWHRLNNPVRIPISPDRAYKKEWISWNDWLGNSNVFPTKKRYRRFKEAKAYAQSLLFKNREQWYTFAKSGNKPDDIPSRPDIIYRKSNEWLSWKDFLGYSVAERIATLQSTDTILFILQYPNTPSNVFRIGLTQDLPLDIKHRSQKEGFKIFKMYKTYSGFNYVNTIEKNLTTYSQMIHVPNCYIVPNIYSLVDYIEETEAVELIR
jgi:hypothetical protein